MKRKCSYCEKVFSNPLTRDHIVPLVSKPVASVTVAICRACNQFKGGDMPVVFIGRLETIIQNFQRVLNITKESLRV